METNLCSKLQIQYPIIQAGMVWCSGWKLASAVSNSGGLGLIGAGSMTPELLQIHIDKCKLATTKSFGVNIPLLYSHAPELIDIAIKNKVKIVFTSAGNPNTYTQKLKDQGIMVAHVVSSKKFALKAQEAGVDFVVAEGVEAGGHNGKEENTTFTLIPLVKKAIDIPLIAAGGIYDGRTMLAAMVLGADAVQMGSRFAISQESSASEAYKKAVIEAKEGDTELILRAMNPVRVLKNEFYNEIKLLEKEGADVHVLKEKLGKGRSKKGIFEGDLKEGELEIGQIASELQNILPVSEIMYQIIDEFEKLRLQFKLAWS